MFVERLACGGRGRLVLGSLYVASVAVVGIGLAHAAGSRAAVRAALQLTVPSRTVKVNRPGDHMI
jgi:hypothetical protein